VTVGHLAATPVREAPVVQGHPTAPLVNEAGDVIQMITLCAECETAKSIILLTDDRWYCAKCRAEGRYDKRHVKTFPIR